jgi:hypothetical protein
LVNFDDPIKSKTANGSTQLFAGAMSRSVWARKCRETLAELVTDLGGPENLSAAERNLLRRASVLTTELTRIEEALANSPDILPELILLYAKASGNLRRLLEAVGLRRRPRDITPSLHDYLRSRASTHSEPEDEDSEEEAETQTIDVEAVHSHSTPPRMPRPRMNGS